MDEMQRPTQFEQAVAKLETYNNDAAERDAQTAEIEQGSRVRELARFGAVALVSGALAVGGTLELGNYLTQHSSARIASERLQQHEATVSTPTLTVPDGK